jgi:hypothetical protein
MPVVEPDEDKEGAPDQESTGSSESTLPLEKRVKWASSNQLYELPSDPECGDDDSGLEHKEREEDINKDLFYSSSKASLVPLPIPESSSVGYLDDESEKLEGEY